MPTKDKISVEEELYAKKCIEEQRKLSDERYAIKLVEKIVFGLVALILTSVVVALLALVITKGAK